MKSLRDISWKVTEEEYRADSALSYSTLSKFNREGFDNIEHLFDRTESPSLLFGSLVDCLLTGTNKEFEDTFLVADFPAISDSQKKIVEYLFGIYGGKEPLANIADATIIDATAKLSYQLNWKPETRAKVIKENCSEYWDLLTLAEGKKVVSTDLYQDALSCIDALKSAESTKWYFEQDNPFDSSIERLYQLKFKGDFDGIGLRCMADLIIVDHQNKIVYPCDLKTSFKPEWRFYKSLMEWGYWIQAQLYWYLIRQTMDKDEYFKDFKLADYRFIVVSNRTRRPLVWEFLQTQAITDLELGKHKLKNWRSIARQLNSYLTDEHKVPIGIEEVKMNDICMWLENDTD